MSPSSAPSLHLRAAGALAFALTLVVACSPEPDPAPDVEDASSPAADPPRPDVVVLLLDTLRPDRLGVYGHEKETAPWLAGLAARGTTFLQAHSTSCWTAPSTASLFTGLHPSEHGIQVGFFVNDIRNRELLKLGKRAVTLNRFREASRTLPERMQALGYRTFGLAANPNIGSEIGFDRGFDRFERKFDFDDRIDPPAEVLEEAVLAWEAELVTDEPTFLYLHFNDVHDPMEQRAPWYEASEDPEGEDLARYDSEISYLDAALARLSERLGWDEETLLIVLSDHGEEFFEHGRRGHGTSLYREQNRIVLMMAGPGLAAGRRVDVNVSLMDVLPTVLDLLGEGTSESFTGRSLVPLVSPERGPEAAADPFAERSVVAHWMNPAPVPEAVPEVPDTSQYWALMHENWRLIEGDDGFMLFDDVGYPGNTRDLAAERPELVRELAGRLEAFRDGLAASASETVEIELDAAQVEALGKLGYTAGQEDE